MTEFLQNARAFTLPLFEFGYSRDCGTSLPVARPKNSTVGEQWTEGSSEDGSGLLVAVARKHPSLNEEHVRSIALALVDELHTELLRRSQRWHESQDMGAIYRETESRACASIVFALGEVA